MVETSELSEIERSRNLWEKTQSWLEEFALAERQPANTSRVRAVVADGMKILQTELQEIWDQSKVFSRTHPLTAQVDRDHPAVPEEVKGILDSHHPDVRGLRLITKEGYCTVKIYYPGDYLRLQFTNGRKIFELHNLPSKGIKKDPFPSIAVWPQGNSAEGMLLYPDQLLAKVIRALPHIKALDYTQS